MNELLTRRLADDATEVPSACIDAAYDVLRSLVDRPDAGREAALDLLTVDALVTYAFEALADDSTGLTRLTGFARDSMRRLATVTPLYS